MTRSNKLPVAPSFDPALKTLKFGRREAIFDIRFIRITFLSLLLGVAAAFIAKLLILLIGVITNLAFYGTFSFRFSSPAGNKLGWFVILIPVVGALIVGIMARYGSKAIRGHGIPEAMEQVLLNSSRIPPRVTFLKPISAAIAIGTGGPFGAEGPIIATGGSLGSLVGQLLHTTADERKTLLAAGAAAGMTATFGSPVSAILLAVELLLFEFRARSIIPVAIACISAAAIRIIFEGVEPVFRLTAVLPAGWQALIIYLVIGAALGVASVFVTRAVYKVEDTFEKLPVHWMWWPAIGAVATGVIGFFVPRTLGVGYENIQDILSFNITGSALIILFLFKFLSWVISLGSGTSGGTLAPLFTIGGGIGAALGSLILLLLPDMPFDIRVAALVGMASMFAGSSRALLASTIFAFEITMEPNTLLPLITACSASFIVSGLMMKTTIMTEKITRRGVKVPSEYSSDYLDNLMVKDWAVSDVTALDGDEELIKVREILRKKPGRKPQGYPVTDGSGRIIGVVSTSDIFSAVEEEGKQLKEIITKPAVVAFDDMTVSEAADQMALNNLTFLPVVKQEQPDRIIGIFSHKDVLLARKSRLDAAKRERFINFRFNKAKGKTKND